MNENYHTHTTRCRHASGSEREYIETAISRGVKVLGFSDHSPQFFPGDYYSSFRMRPEETEDYLHTLSSLREEYKNQIDIKIGFEAEYYPEIFDKLINFIKPYDLDYLILGQHFLDNEYDSHIGCYSFGHTEENLEKYVNQCIEALSTGKFTYIAHPDILIFDGDDNFYTSQYRRLCEYAKKFNVPLEINFLGIATGRAYPSDKFFSIAKSVGNTFIFGSDAHAPDNVCRPDTVASALAFASSLNITPIDSPILIKP